LAIAGTLALLCATAALVVPAAQAASPSWPTYLHDNARTGFNGAEEDIGPATVGNLALKWTARATGDPRDIFAQPIIAGGVEYWGSFNGFEYATSRQGKQLWKTFLGQTSDAQAGCEPPTVGVASTATVATMPVNGQATPVLLTGGGDATFYALNAVNGAILWKTRLGPTPSSFIWSSAAVYHGSVYIGLASFGDCPLVQGRVVRMDARTGAIQSIFKTVPDGCIGGGVWGSPAIDEASNTVFIVTGNPGTCSTTEPLTESMIKLDASSLARLDSWSAPPELVPDSDWGATTTLFSAAGRHFVGSVNKNGIYYALDRDHLSAGPVWTQRVGVGGDCPQCGTATISPSAWDGKQLYVASGITTINGASCAGSLRALNPATGAFIWENCISDGPVLGAVTAVPGVATVGAGTAIVVADTATGKTRFKFNTGGADIFGPASIANGVLYQGDLDGNLYAFGT
jgi:polyvinyl alcohol dehydrogenase (cytochrome)